MALMNTLNQSFNTVLSNIPQTEAYRWTVRKACKEKQKKYAKMRVIAHERLLKIYTSDDKVFECVLHGPRDDSYGILMGYGVFR